MAKKNSSKVSGLNSTAVLDTVVARAAKFAAIKEAKTVGPGQEARLTQVNHFGDGVCQGDLILIVGSKLPRKGFKKMTPSEMRTAISSKLISSPNQLVPGQLQGSRHCLGSLEGIEMYHPENWTELGLVGPIFRTLQGNVVTHPTHGPVYIEAGMIVVCRYAREWDKEQAAERRARD